MDVSEANKTVKWVEVIIDSKMQRVYYEVLAFNDILIAIKSLFRNPLM
jgi:hypothetical protein